MTTILVKVMARAIVVTVSQSHSHCVRVIVRVMSHSLKFYITNKTRANIYLKGQQVLANKAKTLE